MTCNQMYSVHLEIVGESTQIVHDVVVCIALHNPLDSFVTQSISSKLPRRSVSGDQLLMECHDPSELFQSVYKLPQRWMVHLEFSLDAPVGGFSVVVSTIQMLYWKFMSPLLTLRRNVPAPNRPRRVGPAPNCPVAELAAPSCPRPRNRTLQWRRGHGHTSDWST